MKRAKLDKCEMVVSLSRQRSIQILIGVGVLYVLLVTLEIPFVFTTDDDFSSVTQEPLTRPSRLESERNLEEQEAPTRPLNWVAHNSAGPTQKRADYRIVSGLTLDPQVFDQKAKDGSVDLYRTVKNAWEVGGKLWDELKSGNLTIKSVSKAKNRSESCPHSVSLSGSEFLARGKIIEIPCGLTLGSHISVVAKPRAAHPEKDPKISLLKDGEEAVMVSQFMMELQGLKTVEGEDPPRILHFNPRLKGDWSGKPVIEQNTCYRMQWGSAMRCEGWKSKADEETGESSTVSIFMSL